GHQQAEAGGQVVPGSASRHQDGAAYREGRSEQRDDDAEEGRPGVRAGTGAVSPAVYIDVFRHDPSLIVFRIMVGATLLGAREKPTGGSVAVGRAGQRRGGCARLARRGFGRVEAEGCADLDLLYAIVGGRPDLWFFRGREPGRFRMLRVL